MVFVVRCATTSRAKVYKEANKRSFARPSTTPKPQD